MILYHYVSVLSSQSRACQSTDLEGSLRKGVIIVGHTPSGRDFFPLASEDMTRTFDNSLLSLHRRRGSKLRRSITFTSLLGLGTPT